MADQGSEGLPSPWLRKKRLGAIRHYPRGRVLNFGCGSGALAEFVSSDCHLGVDMDKTSLAQARELFPKHSYNCELPHEGEKFDSIVSLAVIEHFRDSVGFLRTLVAYLNESDETRLVSTTPHPSIDWIHNYGATVGLFSKHANEEHEDLLDRTKLELAGRQAGLELVSYRRFLLGANQIAVFKKDR